MELPTPGPGYTGGYPGPPTLSGVTSSRARCGFAATTAAAAASSLELRDRSCCSALADTPNTPAGRQTPACVWTMRMLCRECMLALPRL